MCSCVEVFRFRTIVVEINRATKLEFACFLSNFGRHRFSFCFYPIISKLASQFCYIYYRDKQTRRVYIVDFLKHTGSFKHTREVLEKHEPQVNAFRTSLQNFKTLAN